MNNKGRDGLVTEEKPTMGIGRKFVDWYMGENMREPRQWLASFGAFIMSALLVGGGIALYAIWAVESTTPILEAIPSEAHLSVPLPQIAPFAFMAVVLFAVFGCADFIIVTCRAARSAVHAVQEVRLRRRFKKQKSSPK